MAAPMMWTPQKTGDLTRALMISFGNTYQMGPAYPSRLLGPINVSTTDTQIAWPEPTIQIHDRGPLGDDITYMSIKWFDRLVTVQSQGVAFQIRRYQNNDLERANAIRSVGLFGDQCGRKASFYDARGVKYLLQNGTNAALVTSRKGGALFRDDHPIGGGSTGTFCNSFSGMEFNALNLGAAVAYIAQIEDGAGDPEGLDMRITVGVPTNYRMRLNQMTDAEILKDVFGTQNAASNTYYKGEYGFEEPIIASHWANQPDVWYVFSETWSVAEEAPLNRMELEGWNLTSFDTAAQLELARSETLETHFKGRVGFAGGNPKRVFRFQASGSQTNDTMTEILANM
jgi:hypothetical protein